jgi:hypothetical protein
MISNYKIIKISVQFLKLKTVNMKIIGSNSFKLIRFHKLITVKQSKKMANQKSKMR